MGELKNKNNIKGKIERFSNTVFDYIGGGVSDLCERTIRRLAYYMGKEHNRAMRHITENHKKKSINLLSNL